MLAVLDQWDVCEPALAAVALELARQSGPLAQLAVPTEHVRHHAPIEEPRTIYCSGANYKKHVVDIIIAQAMDATQDMSPEERRAYGQRKMDERARHGTPYFFVKSSSTVTGPHDAVVLPWDVEQPDFELELGVVIGRPARRVTREIALDCIAGYVIVNDLTSRDRVNRGGDDVPEMGMNWVASKGSPTFLPMGPYLVPGRFVGDPQALQIVLKLNGDTMQDESTADMIFGVARLIETLSESVLLRPGDLICTGSPSGNGIHHGRLLRDGDVLEGSITGLGTQRNACVAEPRSSDPRRGPRASS